MFFFPMNHSLSFSLEHTCITYIINLNIVYCELYNNGNIGTMVSDLCVSPRSTPRRYKTLGFSKFIQKMINDQYKRTQTQAIAHLEYCLSLD